MLASVNSGPIRKWSLAASDGLKDAVGNRLFSQREDRCGVYSPNRTEARATSLGVLFSAVTEPFRQYYWHGSFPRPERL